MDQKTRLTLAATALGLTVTGCGGAQPQRVESSTSTSSSSEPPMGSLVATSGDVASGSATCSGMDGGMPPAAAP